MKEKLVGGIDGPYRIDSGEDFEKFFIFILVLEVSFVKKFSNVKFQLVLLRGRVVVCCCVDKS